MTPHPKPYSFRRHLAWSVILGTAGVMMTTGLVMTWLQPSSWALQADLTPAEIEPQYIEPISPGLSSATLAVPAGAGGEALLGGVNLGVDSLTYEYGASIWDMNYQPWDPSVSDEPTNVSLIRYRFGWPMRFLSYDDISTGASVNNPVVKAYHQRAYDLAGVHRGLDRPSWLPGFIPLYRVPIAVEWWHLVVNLLLWTLVTFAWLGVRPLVRRWVRTRRIRRGLCVGCCYPLDGLDLCPECGTAAHKQSTLPTPEG